NVPYAALGDDEAGMRRVGLDLAPQAQDLHVDGAVVDLGVVQAREVQELLAREDALRRREERGEQAKLALGELDRLAFRASQLAQADVQLPAAEAVGPHLRNGIGYGHLRARAAQKRADAGKQLARAEGLGEVIVRAELEAHHAVGLLCASGEHQDRDAGSL